MKKQINRTISLSEGSFFSARIGNAEIMCRRGILWVTAERSGDIILRQGESSVISSRTPVCVTAMADAAFTLSGKANPHSKRETIAAFLSFMLNGRESSRRTDVLE